MRAQIHKATRDARRAHDAQAAPRPYTHHRILARNLGPVRQLITENPDSHYVLVNDQLLHISPTAVTVLRPAQHARLVGVNLGDGARIAGLVTNRIAWFWNGTALPSRFAIAARDACTTHTQWTLHTDGRATPDCADLHLDHDTLLDCRRTDPHTVLVAHATAHGIALATVRHGQYRRTATCHTQATRRVGRNHLVTHNPTGLVHATTHKRTPLCATNATALDVADDGALFLVDHTGTLHHWMHRPLHPGIAPYAPTPRPVRRPRVVLQCAPTGCSVYLPDTNHIIPLQNRDVRTLFWRNQQLWALSDGGQVAHCTRRPHWRSVHFWPKPPLRHVTIYQSFLVAATTDAVYYADLDAEPPCAHRISAVAQAILVYQNTLLILTHHSLHVLHPQPPL